MEFKVALAKRKDGAPLLHASCTWNTYTCTETFLFPPGCCAAAQVENFHVDSPQVEISYIIFLLFYYFYVGEMKGKLRVLDKMLFGSRNAGAQELLPLVR